MEDEWNVFSQVGSHCLLTWLYSIMKLYRLQAWEDLTALTVLGFFVLFLSWTGIRQTFSLDILISSHFLWLLTVLLCCETPAKRKHAVTSVLHVSLQVATYLFFFFLTLQNDTLSPNFTNSLLITLKHKEWEPRMWLSENQPVNC